MKNENANFHTIPSILKPGIVHMIMKMNISNFHTIPSILKPPTCPHPNPHGQDHDFHTIPSILKQGGLWSRIRLKVPDFHTIPSILKQAFREGLLSEDDIFPYDSVYFKAQEIVRKSRQTQEFPYDSVYFKAQSPRLFS